MPTTFLGPHHTGLSWHHAYQLVFQPCCCTLGTSSLCASSPRTRVTDHQQLDEFLLPDLVRARPARTQQVWLADDGRTRGRGVSAAH